MFTRSAQWYDLFFAGKDYAGEARQVAAVIRERRPDAATLLDVACGTGRHLEHLCAEFACEGLDLDEGLLAVARRRLPGVRLTLGDMVGFDLGRRFDAVTCLFSAIGYTATPDRLAAALRSMADHLEPGGVLVVEPWLLPETWQDGVTGAEVVEDGPATLVRVSASRRDGVRSTVRFHYARAYDGEVESSDEVHELTLFTRDEYRTAAADAGFTATWDDTGITGRGLMVGVLS